MNIILRPDYSLGMGDLGIPEPADDMDEGVGLAEGAEVSAVLDLSVRYPGQVDELERRGDFFLVWGERGDPVEPGVGDGTGPLVGLALSVLVGVDLDPGPGDQVEQGRLPGLGVAEKSEVHAFSKSGFFFEVKLLRKSWNSAILEH